MQTAAFACALLTTLLVLRPIARGAANLARAMKGSALGASWRSLCSRLDRAVPGACTQLARRTGVYGIAGLPLTLFVAGMLGLAAWWTGTLSTDWIVRWDHWAERLVVSYRPAPVVNAFAWLTNVGKTVVLAGIVLAASGLLYRDRASLIVPLWLAFLGTEASTWLAKYGFGRPRPDIETAIAALGPSFPSAHASGSVAVFGFLAYAIARSLDPEKRFEVWYAAVVLVFLVGFSRVFLGVHYVSDVVGGWVVGAFWVLVAVALTQGQSARAVGSPQ